MNPASETEKVLRSAIVAKRTVEITFEWGGNGGEAMTLSFHPYIYGDDAMQYRFVWGYLPDSEIFYKFMDQNVIKAEMTSEPFEIAEGACYIHAQEEQYYDFVEQAYSDQFPIYRRECPKKIREI